MTEERLKAIANTLAEIERDPDDENDRETLIQLLDEVVNEIYSYRAAVQDMLFDYKQQNIRDATEASRRGVGDQCGGEAWITKSRSPTSKSSPSATS